jgi:hypothetical protein
MNNDYKILLKSELDWNKGNDSTMRAMDRVYMNKLFLEYLHNSFKEKKEVIEEEHIPGGFDD